MAHCGLHTHRTAFAPQLFCNWQRIDLVLVPPTTFITSGMVFGMVDGTEGYRELITDLKRQTFWLGIADVMRLRGNATTDEAGLTRDKVSNDPLIEFAWVLQL